MLRSIALIAILSLTLAAQANEAVEPSLRSKALASAGSVTKHADAPFTAGRDPLPQVLLLEGLELHSPRGNCDAAATDICYDLTDRHIVYRPARNYMPSVTGMRAESLSLRRNRVVFKYSFR